jgi:hypothetical protein
LDNINVNSVEIHLGASNERLAIRDVCAGSRGTSAERDGVAACGATSSGLGGRTLSQQSSSGISAKSVVRATCDWNSPRKVNSPVATNANWRAEVIAEFVLVVKGHAARPLRTSICAVRKGRRLFESQFTGF